MKETRRYNRITSADAERWAEKYRNKESILKIAEDEGADPGTVSTRLHKLGLNIKQGQHMVPQPPLQIPERVMILISKGATEVRSLVESRVFGLRSTQTGIDHLEKYCRFIQLHEEGRGVEEIACLLDIHRSTVAEWRNGTDMPYLVKVAGATSDPPRAGWKWLPLTLSSGGNSFSNWIEVPSRIEVYDDILHVVDQLPPLATTYIVGDSFGLPKSKIDSMRLELFAYLLGFMLGDASKLGGEEERFSSLNIDLQLSLKQESNLKLGEFVCMCANSIGLRMRRIADKQPTGDSKLSPEPVGAYRWSSERSPLLAWVFVVCMGLQWGEDTSHDPVRMGWILTSTREFRVRFVQGLADSDATVKPYDVILTSVPNADFVTELLQSLGMKSAHTIRESGKDLRSMVSRREAITLPIFNDYVRGYRYELLNRPFVRGPRRGARPWQRPFRLGPSG